MQIEKSESLAISYLRVIALLSIVSCHFLQARDNRWAWVLNIGVQVFFFISGYLYGHKEILNWIAWYKGRIRKVYVPFIIVAIISLGCYSLFSGVAISKWNLIAYITDTQWFLGGVEGLGHLWFMTAIMICYLTTPLLQSLKSIPTTIIILLVSFSLYELLIMRYDVKLFIPIFIYSFGYFYGRLTERLKIVLTAVMLVMSIVVLYYLTWSHILVYDGIMNQLFHTYVGIATSILVITFIWKYLFIKTLPSIVRKLDDYSYEIYLIHHPLILGPLSILTYTGNFMLNIATILLITGIGAFGLKRGCSRLQTFINK